MAAIERRGSRSRSGNGGASCGSGNDLVPVHPAGILTMALMAWSLLAGAPAGAQELAPPPPPPLVAPRPAPVLSPQQALRVKLNRETLIVAAGRPGASYLAMANDLTAALGAAHGVRLLPVAADGGLANLQDLLFLRGVDMAIVPVNVLAHAIATQAFGSGLPQKLAYLTTLYSEEVHVIAGQGVASIDDLRGRKVAVLGQDGTAEFTVGDIFRRLQIEVEKVPAADPADALQEVRNGTVAAAVLIGGKPLAQISALPKDGSLRVLSLPSPRLPGEGYAPAVLRSEDYPALIPPGAIVDTVAVGAVLVVSKASDESVRRVAKHAPAVLDAIARLAVSERHPRWKNVNLGAVLPGWSRLEAAEAWLNRAFEHRREQLQGQFEEFLRVKRRVKPSEISTAQRNELFKEFEAWSRQSVASQQAAK